MANQGSGLGKDADGDSFTTDTMKDQSSFNARDGAAKKPQTSFQIHPGMTDQQRAMAGVSPANPGDGPVADGPKAYDPLSASERGKTLRRQPQEGAMRSSWDMKGADGKGLDNSIGGKVLGEAILSGSAKLPSSESYSTSGPKNS